MRVWFLLVMTLHLAILRQPYLNLILCGEKTIESRFSKIKSLPYHRVAKEDKVLLKEAGGKVLGEFTVAEVLFFDLDSTILTQIKVNYGSALCADRDKTFWQAREACKYATLLWVKQVKRYLEPYCFPKCDRRAWLILGDV